LNFVIKNVGILLYITSKVLEIWNNIIARKHTRKIWTTQEASVFQKCWWILGTNRNTHWHGNDQNFI